MFRISLFFRVARIVEHAKTNRLRGNFDGSTHDGRTPHTIPPYSGTELTPGISLRNAATENSALLGGPGIAEHLNGVAESDDSRSVYSNASPGAGNRNNAVYGAVQTGSPLKDERGN